MRILIVTQHFPPMPSSAALRSFAWARAWAEAGEDVTVLTTEKHSEHATHPRHAPGVKAIEVAVRTPSALRWLRTRASATGLSQGSVGAISPPHPLARLRERSGAFGSTRMPDLTDWWVRPALRAARAVVTREGRWDVIVSSAGPYTAHLIGERLRRDASAHRWVADYRDLWTGNPIYPGLPFVRSLERHLERRVLRSADLVTTVSPDLAEWFASTPARRVEVVYNGFIRENRPRDCGLRLDPPDSVHLVHTGTIYPSVQNPLPLCRAMRLLADRGVETRLHIAGIRLTPWILAAREAGVENQLVVRGVVSHEEAIEMQSRADILVTLGFAPAAAGSIPGKLYEYLLADAPILLIGGQAGSAAGQLLEHVGGGCSVADDPSVIAARIESRPCVARRPDILAGYDRDRQARQLLDVIRTL